MNPQEEKFMHAMKLAEQKDYEGAEKTLREVIEMDPSGDIADDALYDIGVLQFQQNKFPEAEQTFLKVINDYPDAKIVDLDGSLEHGRTAAKAYLGLINCYLPMGREAEAYAVLDKLAEYDNDTYMQFTDQRGVTFRKTYRMLAEELLDKFAAAKSEAEQENE